LQTDVKNDPDSNKELAIAEERKPALSVQEVTS